MDALFTSVTSVCVTGLVTVVPAEQFTLFGKIMVLILIGANDVLEKFDAKGNK